MRPVYFDTTIYDHIAKTDRDIKVLRADLARREILVNISIINVEELLGDWDTKPQEAIRRLSVARDLVGFDSILKQPSDLLKEAIEAYATDGLPPSSILPWHQRRLLCSLLNEVADGNAQFNPVLSRIVAELRREKEAFKKSIARGREESLDKLTQKYELRVLAKIPFEEFWSDAALWAEAIADHFGLGDACRERGLDGLLEVRAVRFCVGAAKSIVYFQVVKSRQPDLGDWHDIWHAIMASEAEVFVTRDKRFAKMLAGLPTNDCRVITTLDELPVN